MDAQKAPDRLEPVQALRNCIYQYYIKNGGICQEMATKEIKSRVGKRRAVLLPGCKYKNRNGIMYECVRRENNDYIMRSEKGWCCRVHHVWQYDDSSIEWDYSSAGWWEGRNT